MIMTISAKLVWSTWQASTKTKLLESFDRDEVGTKLRAKLFSILSYFGALKPKVHHIAPGVQVNLNSLVSALSLIFLTTEVDKVLPFGNLWLLLLPWSRSSSGVWAFLFRKLVTLPVEFLAAVEELINLFTALSWSVIMGTEEDWANDGGAVALLFTSTALLWLSPTLSSLAVASGEWSLLLRRLSEEDSLILLFTALPVLLLLLVAAPSHLL